MAVLAPLVLRARPIILVVDDDRMIRAMSREALEEEGYDVVEAADGAEAMDLFEKRRPDLLMLDVEMPGRDGISVCRELRERYPEDPTPILIVTAADGRGAIDGAYDAGATDFASKPLNWALLQHRVRFLLRASRALRELHRSEGLLAEAQRLAGLGHWSWNAETDEMSWSDEIYRIFGLAVGGIEPNVRNWWDRIHPDDRDSLRERVASLGSDGSFSVEHRVLVGGETVKHVLQQAEASNDGTDSGAWLVGTLQDITERRRAQDEIRYLANFDGLTGLANRRHFVESLDQALELARVEDSKLALLYLDLDRFKRINDSLGHAEGDDALRQVSEVLRRHVRSSDVVARLGSGDQSSAVSRLGGDEFTILLYGIPTVETAGEVARRILRDLPESVSVGPDSIAPTGSIGIAVFPSDGEDAAALMKSADTAMYHAKEAGRNSYQFFCPTMSQKSLRKLQVESALRGALDRDELELHYQPRIDLQTGVPVAMEALLRWTDPELGKVSPVEALAVAAESDLIDRICVWNFETACAQIRSWCEQGHTPLPVAVNVPPKQVASGELCELVTRVLRETGVPPALLEIEITEHALLQNDETVALTLRELRAIGIQVALDDFGTGYSSLSYLTRLPASILKLDRSFVLEADFTPGGVICCVIAMAKGLGMCVVAEGVDDKEQASALRELGCDELQGFLVSPAVDGDQAIGFLEAAAERRSLLP
jgi:diguanylate cyclase (GGDEF)-like protein